MLGPRHCAVYGVAGRSTRARKGIGLASKAIPTAVFDERTADKAKCQFFYNPYAEAQPRHCEGKDKLTLRIESADFSVHDTQSSVDIADGVPKEGKNTVL